MVAKVDYAVARQAAIDVTGYKPREEGMSFSDAKTVLEESFGVKSARYDQPTDWSELPDLAIVTVAVDGDPHAVVFARENGRELIYDSHNYGPVSRDGYRLDSDCEYLEIL